MLLHQLEFISQYQCGPAWGEDSTGDNKTPSLKPGQERRLLFSLNNYFREEKEEGNSLTCKCCRDRFMSRGGRCLLHPQGSPRRRRCRDGQGCRRGVHTTSLAGEAPPQRAAPVPSLGRFLTDGTR